MSVSTRTASSLLLAQLLLAVACVSLRSECPKPSSVTPSASEQSFDAKGVIAQLVNKNAAPELVGDSNRAKPIFDRRHDWKEDALVAGAIAQLVEHCEAALPELLKHTEDREYCMTYDSALLEHAENYTVGDACWQIVTEMLSEAHAQYIPQGNEVVYRLRYADRGESASLEAWCLARTEKKLYELQIAQSEMAIRKIAAADGIESNEQRKAVDSIRAEIKRLQDNRAPVLPWQFGERRYLARYYATSACSTWSTLPPQSMAVPRPPINSSPLIDIPLAQRPWAWQKSSKRAWNAATIRGSK